MMDGTVTARDIELAIASWLGIRTHIIVPNVSWGLNLHECDILAVSKSGYATEIEIKISASDLRADMKKGHQHDSPIIRYLYFAMPAKLSKYAELVPQRAGIIIVENGSCLVTRNCQVNSLARKLDVEEQLQVARLGVMRIWNLKASLRDYSKRQCVPECII